MKTYSVHYGMLVRVVTTIGVAAMLGIVAMGVLHGPGGPVPTLVTIVLPLALLVGSALHAVLRYEIDATGLHVRRPAGRSCVARSVSDIIADDEALEGALRLFGNGGLFSINGWYGTRRYGRCRVWATERANLVVLRGDRGRVILSPRDRDAFVAAVAARFGVHA